MSDPWFYANTWSNLIVTSSVEKHTDSSVWIDGSRRSRRTTGEVYAPTWDEAHAFLTEHWQEKLTSARRQLEYMNAKMGNVKGLRPPVQSSEHLEQP